MTKSPHREYAGFFQFLASTAGLIFILIWSIIPTSYESENPSDESSNCLRSVLHTLLDLLPQRHWIVTIECIVLMGMLAIYLGILTYNEDVLTVPLHDISTITDRKAKLAKPNTYEEFIKKYAFSETSGVLDLPVTDVCKMLYETTNGKDLQNPPN
ncbi:LAMI_0D12024g1_1 [Lachancea mirantina]|uniref:Phosphatidylinositol N-acetylglucosaminyltransferase subunit GPI19 n=1 Tax=Lachancea mirantina TaxID=1230905 RepID=A0A1G4JFI4_9SACH|nr:LAMI_0D12024g1_1 [Lachancea mirantina]